MRTPVSTHASRATARALLALATLLGGCSAEPDVGGENSRDSAAGDADATYDDAALDAAPDAPIDASIDAVMRRDDAARDSSRDARDADATADADVADAPRDALADDALADGRTVTTPRDDFCWTYELSRQCADENTLVMCASSSSSGSMTRIPCEPGERCVMRGTVGACVPAGACAHGSSRCADGGAIERCEAGAWRSAPCEGACLGGPLGAACVPAGPTRVLHGEVRYTRKPPADDRLSWLAPVERPARGFAVHARRGDLVVGRAVTDDVGRFEMSVPESRLDGDQLEVIAATGEAGHIEFAVGDPGLSAGLYRPDGARSTGAIWSWRWPLPDDGAIVTISLEDSPGAALFDDVRAGIARVRSHLTDPPQLDLIAWVRRGVEWTCGSCFGDLFHTRVAGQRFASQLWIRGNSDEVFWSDAVSLHELGHWVMAAWGTLPREGGAHYLGYPTMPGQAWSEGWATWTSCDIRDDSRLYSVSRGTFFWADIARRASTSTRPWERPNPAADPLQPLDENEVSATLWALSHASGDDAPGSAGVYRALVTPRMNASPWARCYTRHLWYDPSLYDACSTGESTPHLADFLDALRCSGVGEDTVHAANDRYPYAASTPICEARAGAACTFSGACFEPEAPFVAEWIERSSTTSPLRYVTARITRAPGLDTPITVTLEFPQGASLLVGPAAWVVAPGASRDVDLVLATPEGVAGEVTLRAESDAGWMRARAVIPLRHESESAPITTAPTAPSPTWVP